MTNIKVEILSGKNIQQSDLDLINQFRKIRLNRDSVWDHEVMNKFHERTFFLVKENQELKSFGTLKPVKIYIGEKEYNIWGIQAVISIVQGKGYGKILIESIVDYVEKSGITMIGFCEKNITPFYKKCGCKIFEDGCVYFIYINKNGEKYTDDPGDVFYVNGSDKFMDDVTSMKSEVIHYIHHW